jgi:hypothetical protein
MTEDREATTLRARIVTDMWINVEVTTQLLDSLAFLLVTPEFLGEHTLNSIRCHLQKMTTFLSRSLVKDPDPLMFFPILLFLLIPISILSITLIIFAVAENGLKPDIRWYFLSILLDRDRVC